MIKHVVCFKLKDNSPQSCQSAKDVLMSMQGKVPLIRDIYVGIDFLHSERSFDVILEVLLDDARALDDYQIDPYHADVVKTYMQKVRVDSITVDYDFD